MLAKAGGRQFIKKWSDFLLTIYEYYAKRKMVIINKLFTYLDKRVYRYVVERLI